MKDWQKAFYIVCEPRTIKLDSGAEFIKDSYYIVDKVTNEKLFPKTRKYGYSCRLDACRGAAHIYKNHMKSLEENLLGLNE